MPIVAMPDGTHVSFPDDMPSEQIRGLIAQKFPQEVAKLAPQKVPTRSAGALAQKAIEPITSYIPTQMQMARESVDQMGRGASQLGVAASGEDAMGYPVPPGERAANVAYGLGNAAMGGVGYLASPLNAALRTVAGKPIEENIGIPKEYTEAALGFVVPVPGANMASVRTVQQVANPRTLTAGERVAQAGQDLAGVGASGPVNVPRAVASDSMAAQRTAATVANVPIAGNPLVEAAGNTTKQLATKTQEIASEYGSASSITAGDAASASIRNWITDKSRDSVKKAYDKVDNLVDDTIKTPLNETLGVAQSILSRRANANITEKSDAVRRVEEAVTNPAGLNYQGVKDLRTYIGELIEKKMLPADLRESELKQIYGSLSQDLRAAVSNAGGRQALSAFERANKYNALVAGRRESLAKIVGADGDTPAAQVFDRLIGMAGNTTRADMSKLAQARKAMGADAWNEVASGIISQMGRVQDATGNVIFSPQRFLTAYQTKLSDAGRSMLFRSAGKENIAPYLDDIATISGRFRELQKFSNPSGTGQATAGFAGFAGAAIDPITTIGVGVGMNVLARALASPATVAPIAQWSRKYEIVLRSPSPANVAQLTIASRNLANTLNSQFGTSVQWQDLIRATQGSVKGRAENEQPEPVGVVNQ